MIIDGKSVIAWHKDTSPTPRNSAEKNEKGTRNCKKNSQNFKNAYEDEKLYKREGTYTNV